MDTIKGTRTETKDMGPSKNARRLVVAATGIAAAAAIVVLGDHPDSTAITIGGVIAFLLVFRLADPAGGPA